VTALQDGFRTGLCCAALTCALAPASWAQQPSCSQVEFSAELLAIVPDMRALCAVVEQLDDRTFAVVEGEVSKVLTAGVLEVRFRRPNGTQTEPLAFESEAELSARTDNGSSTVRALTPGDSLALFIDVERPEIALEPAGADEPLVLSELRIPASALAGAAKTNPITPSGGALAIGVVLLIGAAFAVVKIRRDLSA